MTFIIGIIYSFQSFYYGFWGIINYCIQWYNVQFDDARNLMMTKAITTSHIQKLLSLDRYSIYYLFYLSFDKKRKNDGYYSYLFHCFCLYFMD